MGELELSVPGTVVRLDPRRKIATLRLRRIAAGRTFKTAVTLPDEEPLAPVVEWGHGSSLGAVTAVRTTDAGETEVDAVVRDDAWWQRLAAGSARVHAKCGFHAIGPDPRFGVVRRVELD
jgi:hypothetical protein